MLSAIEEIRFWTAIMRDHGQFILDSLSYNEQEAMRVAAYYLESFSALHEQSKKLQISPDMNALVTLEKECMNLLLNFIGFKKALLGKMLVCGLKSSLPPTFYNHMINEAMEFYKTLVRILNNTQTGGVTENLELHLVWLPDAAGHAATIACQLDPAEKLLICEANEFEKCFLQLATKAEELSRMLERTGLSNGALKYLNTEALTKITEFTHYLEKIRELRAGCSALGVLNPLVPFHMIREENYYMEKLKSVGEGKL